MFWGCFFFCNIIYSTDSYLYIYNLSAIFIHISCPLFGPLSAFSSAPGPIMGLCCVCRSVEQYYMIPLSFLWETVCSSDFKPRYVDPLAIVSYKSQRVSQLFSRFLDRHCVGTVTQLVCCPVCQFQNILLMDINFSFNSFVFCHIVLPYMHLIVCICISIISATLHSR